MGLMDYFLDDWIYKIMLNEAATKTMEMIWKGSDSLGEQSWLFTGVIPRTYSPPQVFLL